MPSVPQDTILYHTFLKIPCHTIRCSIYRTMKSVPLYHTMPSVAFNTYHTTHTKQSLAYNSQIHCVSYLHVHDMFAAQNYHSIHLHSMQMSGNQLYLFCLILHIAYYRVLYWFVGLHAFNFDCIFVGLHLTIK